ncbi:hypothetical protein Q9Q94_04070 [Uliginosibacterium sp. 31-16]|uniref:hypothetical protein n=1 Tax=Uliginosibacterium sp. 31-16 TaxID=3068315 RepID=UPI00273F3D62|nr:hypothetical protein [Uliginosibacterium sp. 31-16]MDP5238689.1 hypothetical protein [Uliginosibacterium sp. 31-16]
MPKHWLAVLLLAVWASAHAEAPAPFSTDGCSEFPDGTPSQKTLWRDCCVAHDLAYWAGGSYAERMTADRELERCVGAVGEPAIAALMLAGVRVGGSPFWPTRFRWGYGWPWGRGYKALSHEERKQVEALSPKLNLGAR